MRIGLVVSCIVMFFVIAFAGLFNLQIAHGRSNRDLSRKNCIRLVPRLGARGKILDRRGEVIVGNKLYYDAAVMGRGIKEAAGTLAAIAPLLGKSSGELEKAFRRGFVVSSLPVVVASNIDIKEAIALEEIKSDLPGLIIQPKPQRAYPYGRLACHVAGYINEIDRWRLTKLADYGYKTRDLVGFGGAEEQYDYYLRQESGGLSIEVDHRGRFVRELGFKEPQSGKDVQLTLDLRIQKIVEGALDGRKGAVVIMDPASGEVLAMSSFPNFNPGIFVEKDAQEIASVVRNSEAPLMNRAISNSYPAGSIFKVIVATAALEQKKINKNTTFVCTGSTQVGRSVFKCWNTHGEQDIVRAIAHSCNVFFYRTGLLAGAQNIHDYAVKFGLAHDTGFELLYETGGFVPSPLWRKLKQFKGWYDGDTANLSIGQGDVLVTPLQIARMMAVFANGGYLVTPNIIKAIDGKQVVSSKKRAIAVPIKDSTMGLVREGLREVVSLPDGTSSILAQLPVDVAGKTGTAQAPPGAAHGWFAGFFPFKDPHFVICVFLERAGAGYHAAVLGKRIIEQMSKEGLI